MVKLVANDNLESMVVPTEFVLLTLFLILIPKYKETCCVNTSSNSQNFLNNRNWSNSCFSQNIVKWEFHITLDDEAFDVKVGCHQGRYGVEIMIGSLFRDRTVSWVRIVNGINKYVTETSEEIPVASVGEPYCEGWAPTKTDSNIVSCVHSWSWTKMDRHWTRIIQSRLFWSIKFYDQIVATWWYGSSRKWWSCKIWRLGRTVQVEVRGYFAMVNWSLDNFPGKRSRTEEKVSKLLEPQFLRTFLVFPNSPGTFTRCTPIKIWKKFKTIWTNPELRCTFFWCNLKLAQRKGLQFYQTRSHAIAFFNTLPAICIEKVVSMKTGEDLYCTVDQSPRLPRVVLTPYL